MFAKVESPTYIGEIEISKKNFVRLLMWSQSEKEINFICFGNGKRIEEVVRLRNTSLSPRKFAEWHEKVSKSIVRTMKSEGKKVIATGHSHPNRWNDQHPSKPDIEAIEEGQIELIVFPPTQSVRAWRIRKNLRMTLKSEVKLKVL